MPPKEMLPQMRVEDHRIGGGSLGDIPVRI